MKFALLGADPEATALAAAALAAGHELVWCGDVAEAHSGEAGWPTEDLGDAWEALLDQDLATAVIIGRGRVAPDLRGEQAIQLAKAGVVLMATFPLVDSVLTYYEIDMARRESDAVLLHFNPLTEQQTVVEQCGNWIAAGHPELGSIEQVVWERPLADRSRKQVLWHFSRDVELLTLVAGGLNRLGALGSPDEAATYAGLSVQLLGSRDVPVRWQVGPIEHNANSHLILIAERGKYAVEFDAAGRAVQSSLSMAGETQINPVDDVDAESQAVERFADVVLAGKGGASTWSRALAAMELADTIEISLRRGRMIEVHQQQLTEQMAFKGMMSALGCGVLLLIPPLLLLGGWLAGLMRLPVGRYWWAYALLGLLALFLGLQLIPKLLFRNSNEENSN